MSNELQAQQGGNMVEVPAYLQDMEIADLGTDSLSSYTSAAFLKIIQDNAKAPYSEFDPGSVIATPLNMELFRPMQSFKIVPIFFYPEYILRNPYRVTGLSYARERSLDARGELAAKCRDFENRSVECPEAPADKKGDSAYRCTYFEVLNFMCLLPEVEDFSEIPIVFSFISTEFKAGRKLASLIRMRGKKPMGSMVFAANTYQKPDENWGLSFDNPEDGPYVSAEQFAVNYELYKELSGLHSSGALKAFEEDAPAPDATEDSPAM